MLCALVFGGATSSTWRMGARPRVSCFLQKTGLTVASAKEGELPKKKVDKRQTLAFAALQLWAEKPAALAVPQSAVQSLQAAVVVEPFALNALSQTPALNAM